MYIKYINTKYIKYKDDTKRVSTYFDRVPCRPVDTGRYLTDIDKI